MSELIAGGIAGALGVFVGQPFDTVKVRLQNFSRSVYKDSWDCFNKTLRVEGISGLYRGMSSPLLGSVALNAVVFAAYEQTISVMNGRNASQQPREAPLGSVFVAGSFAGFLQTLILCPIDFVKCNLQVSGESTASGVGSKGSLSSIMKDLRMNGVGRMYQGFLATNLRETPSYGLYFSVYHGVNRCLTPTGAAEASAGAKLFAGGLAGLLSWASIYPVDVVKTNIQTLPAGSPKEHFSCFFQLRKLFRENSIRRVYRGVTTTLVRAFIVNAVTFYGYEVGISLCNDYT